MGTYSNMPYDTIFLLLPNILDELAIHYVFKIFYLINIMNHTKIKIIYLKTFHKVFECRNDLIHLTGTYILAVLPSGTEMALNDPILSCILNGYSNIGSYIRLTHPTVKEVYSLFMTIIDQFL